MVWRPSSFIDQDSIMYDPAKTPPTFVQDNLASGNINTKEAILRVTGANVLPQPILLQALKDSFFEHVHPLYYSVIDREDVSGPNASILVQQAVSLAGSLMRHGQDNMSLAEMQYEKVKTLVHVGFEPDQLTVLKALCLLSCWSPSSPYLVTLDGPWHWTGVASRMALQLGLQKQSTPEDTDVEPLTEEDFEVQDFGAIASTYMTKLIRIIGKITQLKTKKSGPTDEDVEAAVTSLRDWVTDLPDGLRLFSSEGVKKPFNQHRAEALIFYLVSIILVQTISRNTYSHWRTSAASFLAASCAARLYDEIRCRERAVHLIHFHAFLVLVVGVVLVSHQPQSQEKERIRDRDMEIVRSVLEGMSAKYGGARAILKKFQEIHREAVGGRVDEPSITRNETTSSQASSTAKIVQDHIGDLFPFPVDFCENMDILAHENNSTEEGILQDDALTDFGRWENFDDISSFMDVLGMDFTSIDGISG
ncbi:hypothetical protein N8I77_009757 [Diaporthe amygdali]|uniref:Xylanolytic transcriptional activator regulatory domain-containing protein n=1 Tax=Phomopsis amygdali TaxID=1214568 RepID=A0AAD9W1A0_PHOAM|nr:hypothetical protein N8I77_009757 [Diaporthe amygdali]